MNHTRSSVLKGAIRNSLIRFLIESPHANGLFAHLHLPELFKTHLTIPVLLMSINVTIIRLITPISYFYHFFYFPYLISKNYSSYEKNSFLNLIFNIFYYLKNKHPLIIFFTIWSLFEVIFFGYYYYLFRKLNKKNFHLPHISVDDRSRLKLVRQSIESCILAAQSSIKSTKPLYDTLGNEIPYINVPIDCLNDVSIKSDKEYIENFFRGWFLDIPIEELKYGNVFSWTSWAFYGKEPYDLTEQEKVMNHHIIRYIQSLLGEEFKFGMNPEAPAIRLDLDPIFVTQRPLCMYVFAYLITKFTRFIIRLMGFKPIQKVCKSTSQIVYYRPKKINSDNDDSLNQKERLPIVFIHGIGMGFTIYLGLIFCFPRDVDVILVEWPNISMTLTPTLTTTSGFNELFTSTSHNNFDSSLISHPDACINHLTQILDSLSIKSAVFVSHSLGTTMQSWLLKHPYHCHRVAKSVILDPITFLLCDPTVASVFVYQDPRPSLVDVAMHFLFSRELHISHMLSRSFAWSYNMMIAEDFFNNDLKTLKNRAEPLMISVKNKKLKDESKDFKDEVDDDAFNYLTTSSSISVEDNEGELKKFDFSSSNEEYKKKYKKFISYINENYNNYKNCSKDVLQCQLDNDKEDINPTNKLPHNFKHSHTIILSNNDSIVPVGVVYRYLKIKQRQFGQANPIDVRIAPGCHGELLVKYEWLKFLSQRINDYTYK